MTLSHSLKYLLSLLIPAVTLLACNQSAETDKGRLLATAGDHQLYSSDLQGIVPSGSSKKDSTEICKNFINEWIRQRLILIQAEENLPTDQKDFAKELDEYRNSLLIYRYESKLVSEKLDTTVSEKEIEDYYNLNKENFELKDNIAKVLYVKLNRKDASLSQIRPLLKSGKDSDINKLESICATSAVNYYLNDKSWLLFNDLLKEIPIKTYDQEAYLQNHRYIEIDDEDYTYLVHFKDFEIKEGLSPLSFERENIRHILVNKRKLLLIEKLEKDAYLEAEKNKDFKVF